MKAITRKEQFLSAIAGEIEAPEPRTREEVCMKKISENGSGGGVSSWNDLTDKPFYEETVEVFSKSENFSTQAGEFYKVFPFGEDIGVTLKTGETITIEWDGVLYDLEVGNPVYKIGNESLSGSGGDTGEPFFLNLAESTCYAKEPGIHTIKTIAKAIKTLDEKYMPSNYIMLNRSMRCDECYNLIYANGNKKPIFVNYNDLLLPCFPILNRSDVYYLFVITGNLNPSNEFTNVYLDLYSVEKGSATVLLNAMHQYKIECTKQS